jgi:hypothetical protein
MEVQIVGLTETDEAIAMVFVCTISGHQGGGQMTGEWFGVRYAARAQSKIEHDFKVRLDERIRRVDESLGRGGTS